MATAQTPPDLHIPQSDHTVTVSIIDTTGHVTLPASMFMEPDIPGHEMLSACCYSFLIKGEHKTNSNYDTLVFDLGLRKDIENSPKSILQMLDSGVNVTIESDVATILKQNGVDLKTVGGIIWSHSHLDHTGDPNTFPSETDVIVGPGFKNAFVPAYPTVEDSPMDERLWEGRNLREINFDDEGKGLTIGQYKAFDFYGDGSFYLLDTPGHDVGHMCALARTSAYPPEFIFMGGDIAHHGAEFRPTQYLPLPENIQPNPLVAPFTRQASVCPGAIFEQIHPQKSSTVPFCKLTSKGVHKDAEEGQESIDKMKEFDAQDNIFVNIAHDTSLYDVIELYPKTANGWNKKGWKQEGRWRFLKDFDTGDQAPKAV